MKYYVTAWTTEEKRYQAQVSIRRDAKNATVFQRCMYALGKKLIEAGEIPRNATFGYELPNIWTNGYCGAAWFEEPFINVEIQEETGAWLAQ